MTAGLVFPHAALPSPLFFLSLFSTCPIVFFSSLLVVPSPLNPRIYLLSPFTNPSLLSVPSSLCAPSSNTPLCKDPLETSLIDAVGSWCYCFLVFSRSGSTFEIFFVFWLLMIRHGLDRVPRTVCLSFSVRSLRDNTILGVFSFEPWCGPVRRFQTNSGLKPPPRD